MSSRWLRSPRSSEGKLATFVGADYAHPQGSFETDVGALRSLLELGRGGGAFEAVEVGALTFRSVLDRDEDEVAQARVDPVETADFGFEYRRGRLDCSRDDFEVVVDDRGVVEGEAEGLLDALDDEIVGLSAVILAIRAITQARCHGDRDDEREPLERTSKTREFGKVGSGHGARAAPP